MQTFLEEVIDQIIANEESLDGLQIILPSKRAGGFFKHYLKQKIDKATFLPSIISIEEFVELIADLKIISSRRLLLHSYQAYLSSPEITDKDDFEVFCDWIGPLLGDLNEIDRHLVDTDSFFDYLFSIKTLENWNAKEQQSELIKNYLTFWKALPDFYENLKSQLEKIGLGYQGMVYRKACEELEHYMRSSSGTRRYFIGFNALNKAEQYILKEMLEDGHSEVFWDTDRAFFDDAQHAASHFMRSYFSSWKYYDNAKPVFQANFEQPKTFHLIQAQQGLSQVKTAGEILSLLEPQQLEKTAIILADEALLVPLLYSLPNTIKQVNVTMGVPLSNFPLTRFFNSLFYLHSKSEDYYYYKDLFPLLQHPLCRQLLSAAEDIIALISENNLAYVPPSFILEQCPEGERAIAGLLFGSWQGSAAIAIENTQAVIERFRDYKELARIEQVVLFEIKQLLDELLTARAKHGYLKTVKSVMRLFEDAVENSSVDFQGDAYKGLQIMGLLETRSLDFENIVMLSVNEGTLPAGKSSASFLTHDLKLHYQLPMYDEKDAVYSYHFYRLLQRAKQCWFIYNGTAEGLNTGEKSRFLLQLETAGLEQHRLLHRISNPRVELYTPKPLVIAKTASAVKSMQQLASSGLSPSALTSYIRNPIDFYFRYVLRVKQQDLLEEVVEYATLGSIVHNSLERLYKPLVGQRLVVSALQTLLNEYQQVVVSEFEALFKKGNYQKGKNLLIFEVAKKYVENLIRMDLQRVEQGAVVDLLAIEEELKAELSVSGLETGCALRGTVDRIERVDGTLRIIDYKTGAVSPGDLNIVDWDEIRDDYKYSKAFQVLTYAYLYSRKHNEPTVEAGIISFKNMGQGFMPYGKKESARARKSDNIINKDVLAAFTDQLGLLVADILDPAKPFTEKEV
jgi:hypothetical protein